MIYILKQLAEEFIKDFHRGIIQEYNKVITLVLRLQEEYIIYKTIYKEVCIGF